MILDEVITGFGRLGAWFGAEVYGVEPDLITFAKGCTSGYLPLGGVVVGRAVLDALEADPEFVLRHGFTYSGHPTACVAGLANLEILEREELFARAPVIADRLGGRAAGAVRRPARWPRPGAWAGSGPSPCPRASRRRSSATGCWQPA